MADEEQHWESTTAWRELLDGIRDLDRRFLTGDRAVPDEQSVAEGYRFLVTILGVAADVYLFSDPQRPTFVDINTPNRPDRRWGGDNTDAYYAFAPIDPTLTYRVSGTPGDSVYWSLTVYNEPSPGQWSNRVVGVVNDGDVTVGTDGRFEFVIGPSRPPGWDGPFVELTADAAAAVTRDYQTDPTTGRRVEWTIEAIDGADSIRESDATTASAMRTMLAWIEENFGIVPLPIAAAPEESRLTEGHQGPVGANVMAEPYRVPDANYGWSATDACYSFGTFSLRDDEALVITHTPPQCRFWNVVVWNPFMGGYRSEYARTSLNHGTAERNPDGSVTVVIARAPTDHPNAISTLDHPGGMIAFRWFHADVVPATPTCEVLPLDEFPDV